MKRISTFLKRGSAIGALWAALAVVSPAQTFTVLLNLNASGPEGNQPDAPLIQATDGLLYGTTTEGGQYGGGIVFKITTTGTQTVLESFGPVDQGPRAPVVQAVSGDFYGTSQGGSYGHGVVFETNASGSQTTTLYNFCTVRGCPDGEYPLGLVKVPGEKFYGTTTFGGANGNGTVFEITTSGVLTTLYSFCAVSGCADGANPFSLTQASDGNFYGTTQEGGANNKGTVFQITSSGMLTTLYSFCAVSECPDGKYPSSGLIQAKNGDFYGTTDAGGANSHGTVFVITSTGKLTTLHSFCAKSECADGATPMGGVIQATDGNFYGTTSAGGANAGSGKTRYGTIYEVTSKGALTTLYSFCSAPNCSDGINPTAGLVQDTDGAFYGTTFLGADDAGSIFSLSIGLDPFVEPQTTSGQVGSNVKILGTDLTGATIVTFNGTKAAFSVSSATLIVATVPTGATTGPIDVVTPSGTLLSNVPFRVL